MSWPVGRRRLNPVLRPRPSVSTAPRSPSSQPSSTCRCSANATEVSVRGPLRESVSSLKSVGPDLGPLLRGLRSPDTEPPLSKRLPAATGKGWSVVQFSQPTQETLRFRLEVGSRGEQKVGRLGAEGRLAWRKNYLEASAPGPRVRTERQGSRRDLGKTVARTGF